MQLHPIIGSQGEDRSNEVKLAIQKSNEIDIAFSSSRHICVLQGSVISPVVFI